MVASLAARAADCPPAAALAFADRPPAPAEGFLVALFSVCEGGERGVFEGAVCQGKKKEAERRGPGR